MEKTEMKHELESLLTELQALRDDVRVRIHLGEMEAKQTWNDLEPRIDRLEKEMKSAATDAMQKLADAAKELRGSLRALRERLSKT
jgi:ferritin-like metal-binding protein YciE